MNAPNNRNLSQMYLPVGTFIAILIALFTFYTQISADLDAKFSAMSIAQVKFKEEMKAEVRIIREAILREHPQTHLP